MGDGRVYSGTGSESGRYESPDLRVFPGESAGGGGTRRVRHASADEKEPARDIDYRVLPGRRRREVSGDVVCGDHYAWREKYLGAKTHFAEGMVEGQDAVWRSAGEG